MSPEQKAAFVMAQIALFQCRVAGMVAENAQRTHRGDSMAYTEADFMCLEREQEALIGHNALIRLFSA